MFHGWIEVPTRGHILNSLCAYLQGAGWQKLRDHSVTSARYGPQHTLFCRDFMFCRDLCAFGELLPKGFTLSEGFQRKVSCFRRDFNERLSNRHKVCVTNQSDLHQCMNYRVPKVEAVWEQRSPESLKYNVLSQKASILSQK